jgi:hypothetical protein
LWIETVVGLLHSEALAEVYWRRHPEPEREQACCQVLARRRDGNSDTLMFLPDDVERVGADLSLLTRALRDALPVFRRPSQEEVVAEARRLAAARHPDDGDEDGGGPSNN